MQKLHMHYSTKRTPQACPLTSEQVKMRSGGHGWQVSDWDRLDRFLVLGTEGGTYYVSERTLTRESAESVLRCLQADGPRTVARIAEISQAGRAPKNDPALFALALAAKLGDEPTRVAAYKALPQVARIGTHLFHFAEYAKAFGGLGGNGFKRAIARWYLGMDASKLAYQAVKYQQRDGWSHRDLLRLSHPRAEAEHQAIFHWIVKGWSEAAQAVEPSRVPRALALIWAFERAKVTRSVKEMVQLITDYRLPHECVPNELKGEAEVWEALLERMPVGAMIRNLNKMTAVGLLSGTSRATKKVVGVLSNLQALKQARVHPMALLMALKTYASGKGLRGQLRWSPVGRIVDALDGAFYLAFGAVVPTGKRLCLALDVSGSMMSGVSAAPQLSCREAAAAMALVTASVEQQVEIVGFTCAGVGGKLKGTLRKLLGRGAARSMSFGMGAYGGSGISPLAISPRQRLDDVVRATSNLPFGGTDCALPMRWALATRTPVDAFVIYTDNESWAGEVHVDQALNDYRQTLGIPAKLVVVALSADRFSVANPHDAGQLDVVGFDAAAPEVIADFIRN